MFSITLRTIWAISFQKTTEYFSIHSIRYDLIRQLKRIHF